MELFEAPTKMPAARWPMASRKPWCAPTGPCQRSCTRRTSTAKSSPSGRSLSRTFWSMPCASRWALSSLSGSQKPPKSLFGPPSVRCQASRRLEWRLFSQGRPLASASSSRTAHSVCASTPRFFPTLRLVRNSPPRACRTWLTVSLDELLSLQPSRLAKKIDGAQVVVVRSQEIDHAGETGFTFQARQVMDTVIDNLARAIRKLAAAGVEQAVVTADHGHLFFPSDRDESMRIDSPGGDEVDLHRRCWIGRGGATPAGCVRVSAAALGYDSDLDFVFPLGSWGLQSGRRSRLSPRRAIIAGVGHTSTNGPHESAETGPLDRWPRDSNGPARRRDEPHLQRNDSARREEPLALFEGDSSCGRSLFRQGSKLVASEWPSMLISIAPPAA